MAQTKREASADIKQQEPLYTMEDADGVIKCFVPCRYGQTLDLCDGIKIRFTDIGHLLRIKY